ncbi:hypothetical protein GTP46_24335 [Duganella sp. FT135W]|uniref:Uncharacterized protein n=1 Tax=Duganella flavida TaxID=2692175 RepID=A0A6L8KME5_9BURK|nr:hypothetical protein [Duganella flavida]MYM25761.1 hypothetical protein [Duganella flavida]
MGAFCVFGISKSACKSAADKAVLTYVVRDGKTISLTVDEWRVKRDAMAAKLFDESEKPVRISPEFDAPQFCEDWMAAAPGEIKLAKVMVRGPKFDGGCPYVLRQPVRGGAQ